MWMGIWVLPYTVTPLQVGVNFWKIGVGLSPSDVVMSWLRLQTPADCTLCSQNIEQHIYKYVDHKKYCILYANNLLIAKYT